MPLPDYEKGSIVNLTSSVVMAMGGRTGGYAGLPVLDPLMLREARQIVLIVIDGLGYQYLSQRGVGSSFHEHLVARLTSVFPSTTASSITSFFTGTGPQQHGITGWFMYLKELGTVTVPLPFRLRFGGVSLKQLGLDASSVFDAVSVFSKIRASSHVLLPEYIKDSAYSVAHSGPAQRHGYTSLEEFFRRMRNILRKPADRKYIYAYWPALDELAHIHGIGSREVASHYAELDSAFRRFLERIHGSSTVVLVTSDHGFVDSSVECCINLEEHPALADTLALPLCGEERIAYCYVRPGHTERFIDYAETYLTDYATVMPSHQLLEEGYFGLGAPHPRLDERIGDYTLIMKDKCVIRDRILGEKMRDHTGVHGGLSDEEIYVPLIVVNC